MPSRKKKGSWVTRSWFFSLLALAILYALPSLAYPFGRDQATFFYISREWWQHNLIPYRDAFDYRAPGIHFLYLIANVLFGTHQYSIRILELLIVLASGVAAAQAAARRRVSPVEMAPVILLSVGIYFTYVDYWDSAQSEIWAAICLLAAQSTIAVDHNRRRASIVSGLWTGTAVILTPYAIFLVPVFFTQLMVAALLERPEPERLPTLVEITAAYVLGFVQPPAAFAAYFATRNGFSQFYEATIRFRPSALHEGSALAALRAWAAHARIALIGAGALWAVALGLRMKKKERAHLWMSAIGPACLIAAFLGICAQGTFDTPHWVLLIPFVTFCAADGLVALQKIWKALPTVVAVALLAAMYSSHARCFANPTVDYATHTHRFWRYARHSIDRNEYLDSFRGPQRYAYRDQEALGEQLRQRAGAGDRLHVFGPDLATYAVSGLRSPSRFFADPPIGARPWLAEQEDALTAQPPRFLVSRLASSDDLVKAKAKAEKEYVESARYGELALFLRKP